MASKIQRAKKVIDGMSYQDRSALAFGFPLESDIEDSLAFDGELSSNDSRTSVNGNWKALKDTPMNDFDGGFDFADDDFDNFLTKRARERNKKRRSLRKEGRAEGKSRKDARKDARKQALSEIPREKVKDIAKRSLGKIGRAIKVGALALPRASFLSLMNINFRGFAWKINSVMTNPQYKTTKLPELKKFWHKLGGKWSKFEKNINKGKGKKPFFCGKKCKKKLLDKDLKKSFTNFNNNPSDSDFYNAIGEEALIGIWVGIGSSVIGGTTKVIGNAQLGKQQKREIEAQKSIAEKELATLSQSEKDQIALAEKKLVMEGDPIKAIANNPNLSAQEKAEAIKLTREALGQDTTSKFKKYALIGGLALVGVVALYTLFKKK